MLTTSLFDIGLPPPCPARFNIAAHVLAGSGAPREKVALRVLADAEGGVAESWTYGALEQAIRATAAGLAGLGLARGDRVMLRFGNVSAFPVAFFAVLAAGGIAVPVSPQLTGPELAHALAETAPRFVAHGAGLAPGELPARTRALPPGFMAELAAGPPGPIADIGADDPAYVVFTSGATGRPKGVLHAHRAAHARRMMWDAWVGLGPGDLMLHAGAFNWTYTLGTGLTDPLAAGASSLIYAGPPGARWSRLVERLGASLFAAVPGVFRQTLREPGDLARAFAALRHGLTAGERMPDALAAEWTRATGKPVFEALGMSECSTYLSAGPGRPSRPGPALPPQPGRRVAVLGEDGQPLPPGEAGMLAVSTRDPGLMLGYWRRPEETEAAVKGEWFLTGDRAAMDAHGYVTHLGRADEVMNTLGYRVGPGEIEEVLARHPGIAEVAVAELPVRPDLSLIAAFVVPRAGMPGEEELAAFAARSLAAYKCPRLWIAVDRLPRSANGKLIRRVLIEAHRQDR